jgi:hypothetical protein
LYFVTRKLSKLSLCVFIAPLQYVILNFDGKTGSISYNPDLNKYNTHFNTTSNPNPITKNIHDDIGNMGKFNVVWINL